MTFPSSTVPAAKDWLYGQLQTACVPAAGIDLLVRFGDPGPFDPQDVVSVGKVKRDVEPRYIRGDLGQGALFETYTIEVDVDVMRAGDDPAMAASDRAWALVTDVENVVRTDPSFGGLVLYGLPGMATSEDGGWDDKHDYYRITVTVELTLRALL